MTPPFALRRRAKQDLATLALLGVAAPVALALFGRTPAAGGVPPDGSVLRAEPRASAESDAAPRGRRAFYEATFGDEALVSGDLALLDGPITPLSIARAVAALEGRGTSDLTVRLDRSAVVGSVRFARGAEVHTGLDVPRGAYVPLGWRVRIVRGRVELGVTCAICHATVDAKSGAVVEGAPNADLAIGLLLALAPHSAVLAAATSALPPGLAGAAREDAVDADLLAWPPGTFDVAADGVNAPVEIPPLWSRRSGEAPAGHAPLGCGGAAAREDLAAFAHALAPPPPRHAADEDELREGARVFARAGCGACHGTRADEAGGAPTLDGLAWTAPYLHDGGVAAASSALGVTASGAYVVADRAAVGVPGTLLRAAPPDPRASLLALVDRDLRAAVVRANVGDARLARAHVTGEGHAYWADAATGLSADDEDALVAFLLANAGDPNARRR